MPPIQQMAPLQNTNFTLDSSGVAGFFGGDEAVSAMAMVHIYEGRKWLGWYNSPGSYNVAKKYGQLANSRVWDALFPGPAVDPASMFGLDGVNGPEYIATHSGTVLSDTGHTGHVFLKICQSLRAKEIEGRGNSTWMVTIAELKKAPDTEINAAKPGQWSHTLMAGLPMLSSAAGCIACGIFQDWYCFSMILLGIFSSGIACLVIGSGTLKLRHPPAANGSPPGDGILHTKSEFVVLRGEEAAVTTVTRGCFSLEFPGEPEYNAIGVAATLLVIQFLLQLLLIPQGTLFGQVLFLTTLGVSWVYNCCLSSFDINVIQGRILAKELGNPMLKRHRLKTRTTAVVFVILALRPPNPSELLDRLLPTTETWKIWKTAVAEMVKNGEKLVFDGWNFDGLAENEKNLLQVLFSDATDAYNGYLELVRESDTKIPEMPIMTLIDDKAE